MKKLLILLSLAGILIASELKVGNTFDITVENQFDKKVTVGADVKKAIIVFSKDNGHLVRDYLDTQDKNFLQSKNAIYVADISGMPSLIYKFFVKGKLQDSNYPMFLIKEDDMSEKYKSEQNEEKIIVATLDNNKITELKEVSSVNDMVKELD
ncbi:MAG TPA: hypothetical protein ENK66_06275 [Arcobacter sp.]|jgi:hypothetical protein|nr:hypothetical protein [Arcobacter sp.]